MKIGIVGLPNVGKSTMFNSITNAGAECANYPFCTIEPNIGVVPVPDERLEILGKMYNTQKITHAIVEFVDIAGLVKGASKGEGLGNKFLSHIRETDAIVEVVRCFEDNNIIHVEDNGFGIPKKDLPHIFERFYRTDASRARKTGGSGIGLTIANSLVKAHGGNITVQSKEGKGSCFTVRLPKD